MEEEHLICAWCISVFQLGIFVRKVSHLPKGKRDLSNSISFSASFPKIGRKPQCGIFFDFSATKILREINFGYFEASKTYILTILAAMYSSLPNKRGSTPIYFGVKMGQNWPKSCIFM